MLITIEIDASSNKAQAFIDFIKTMDFIKIKDKESPEEYALTKKQISMLEERKQRHINKTSKSYSWDEIKEELKSSSK